MSYQQIIIVGNVGRDPEMQYTPSGVAVCTFSVAVNRTWTDRNSNEKKEKTTWFRVSAWRALAETCSQYVHKGMQIMVVGEIDTDAYMGNDGQPKSSLKLTARDIRFIGRKGESSGGGYQPADEEAPPWGTNSGGYDTPDDIPF